MDAIDSQVDQCAAREFVREHVGCFPGQQVVVLTGILAEIHRDHADGCDFVQVVADDLRIGKAEDAVHFEHHGPRFFGEIHQFIQFFHIGHEGLLKDRDFLRRQRFACVLEMQAVG